MMMMMGITERSLSQKIPLRTLQYFYYYYHTVMFISRKEFANIFRECSDWHGTQEIL